MIPTYHEQYGWLTAAKSDDGLVAATHIPRTTLCSLSERIAQDMDREDSDL